MDVYLLFLYILFRSVLFHAEGCGASGLFFVRVCFSYEDFSGFGAVESEQNTRVVNFVRWMGTGQHRGLVESQPALALSPAAWHPPRRCSTGISTLCFLLWCDKFTIGAIAWLFIEGRNS